MVTPAVVVSKTWSKVPANRLTSVDVPPMSKPMIGFWMPLCAKKVENF
jgi:hypothetical protein